MAPSSPRGTVERARRMRRMLFFWASFPLTAACQNVSGRSDMTTPTLESLQHFAPARRCQ